MSHGKAAVDIGFSINKATLIENMQERSVIALGTVCDAVSNSGDLFKVDITKQIMLAARNAHSCYHEELNEKKLIEKKSKEQASKNKKKRKEERQKMDLSKKFTDRNFITPLRAMNEYLLKPSDLESLRKTTRRSPFEDNPPIQVYLRRDVEQKSIEVWGSEEALQRELKKRKEEEEQYRNNIFHVKKILKEYTRFTMHEEERKRQELIIKTSGRVVLTAVVINATNFALKVLAWLYTGSHSMFAEAIHSLADTGNQLILFYGIKKSLQTPTQYHPYGYHNMRYVASLISGVGVFFLGTGLSVYHGINGILHPETMESLYWAYVVLGGSLISEGGTLVVAFRETMRGAKRDGLTFLQYAHRNKLQNRSRPGVFIGYALKTVGYRIWYPDEDKVDKTKHVFFNESKIGMDSFRNKNVSSSTLTFIPEQVEEYLTIEEKEPPVHESTSSREWKRVTKKREKGKTAGQIDVYYNPKPGVRLRKRELENLTDEDLSEESSEEEHSAIVTEIPKSYRKAITSSLKEKWINAMETEIAILKDREVWEIVPRPINKTVIITDGYIPEQQMGIFQNNRWVYSIKENAEDQIEGIKVHLVAQGFHQVESSRLQ
ncbi:Zinc transporter 9 [Araneus ventricosus]|uniref:Zinc transporter 9 n=1 Tax=Araneus ventricosus TaxID=182803 RepID=A0A4Y2N087_ARAVE|nr:Zinc transporter 9 [Araneus ventricosus]